MPIINGTLVTRESSSLEKAVAAELAAAAEDISDEELKRLAEKYPAASKEKLD